MSEMYSLHLQISGTDCIDNKQVVNRFYQLIEFMKLHVRDIVRHDYYPYGATITAILSESHMTLSTWPEKGQIQIDLFICSERGIEIIIKGYKEAIGIFHASFYSLTILDRESMVIVSHEGGGDSVVLLNEGRPAKEPD